MGQIKNIKLHIVTDIKKTFAMAIAMNRLTRDLGKIPRLLSVCQQRNASSSSSSSSSLSYKFVVVGGGSGGLSIASYLARKFPNQVAVVEPSSSHYYQPMWTLVGAGLKDKEQSVRPMADVMPKKAKWIKEKVSHFAPEDNTVVTDQDTTLKYDFLVVALGLNLEFNQIPGLVEALDSDGVACNYSFDTVDKTHQALQNVREGNALFTLPNPPVKCLGAPQKIMYLAEEIFRKNGVRDKVQVTYKTPGGVLFAVEKYRNSLLKLCNERDIQIDLFRNLVSIDASRKEATFQCVDDTETPKREETIPYEFIHVTPPMGPVKALKSSALVDGSGFVDVDKESLQHTTYSNVFALGDCSNLPVSKTLAAVGSQSGVLRKNLMSLLKGKPMEGKYTGYASCPLITGSDKCILAEFDYSGLPRETFPVDQGVERTSMYHMKASVMPHIYWQMVLEGVWDGPETYRKMLHMGMV